METLYMMQSCNAALSGLWAWQKEIYKMAEHYEHCLFTEKGVKELAAKMQKAADRMKGKEREIRFFRYTSDDDPIIGIGPGGHSVSVRFVKIRGSWAPMAEKVEATRGEIFSMRGNSDGFREVTIRFYNCFPMQSITRQAQLATENSLHARYPKDLQYVMMLKGALKRRIRKLEKDGKQCESGSLDKASV